VAGRRIVVEFLGKDAGLGKTANDVEGKTSSMGQRMSKVGKLAGAALAGGLLVAGAAAVKMGKAAAEDEAGAAKLAQTLRTAAGATKAQTDQTEQWITAQGKAFGVADDDLRPALARLAASTHDVGQAQKLASLAMDVSAGTGKSLTQVTEALQKGVNGSVGGLSRLGVATKGADGKTKSLKDITADLAKTYSGAAAYAADTTAGKQKILAVQFQELQETIGAKLLPVMNRLTEWALKAIDWMGKHATLIKGITSVALPLVAGLYLLARAQAAVNLVMTANPIGLVIVAVAALAAGLIYAYKHSETFRNIVKGTFDAVGRACYAMWNNLIKPILKLWINQWFLVVGALVNGAAKAFGWVPGLGPKLRKAADWFNDFKKQVNDTLDGVHDKKVKISAPGADHTINQLKTLNNLLNVIDNKKQANVNVTTPGMFNPGSTKKPHFAAGTTHAPGGWSWVGERGPELVNLRRGAQVVPAGRSAAATSGQPIIINISGALDPSAVAKQIEQILTKYQRTSGRQLAFI